MRSKRNETCDLPTVAVMTALPIELIQKIANQVPVSGLISLKLVAKVLYFGLTSPPSGYLETASDCEKRAVRRYVTEREHILGGRRKCIICDGLMPLDMYRSWTEPVCRWHLGWFERAHVIKETSATDSVETTITPRTMVAFCGHCKEIQGFGLDRCACGSEDVCESCGRWGVECRVKVARQSIMHG
jgi:hypothetical protein